MLFCLSLDDKITYSMSPGDVVPTRCDDTTLIHLVDEDTGGPVVGIGPLGWWPNPVSPVLRTDLYLYPVVIPDILQDKTWDAPPIEGDWVLYFEKADDATIKSYPVL